jgi:hypothetical protein
MAPAPEDGGAHLPNGAPDTFQGTTGTIAAKLDCKTGPDLLVAAAAHLTMVQRQNVFGRRELISEIKGATAYYQKHMENNFTQNMRSLIKADDIRETSKGKFALSAKKLGELKPLLV